MATRKRAPRRSGTGAAGRAANAATRASNTTAPALKPVKSKRRSAPVKPKKARTTAKNPARAKAGRRAKKAAGRRDSHPLTPYLTVADAAASLAFYAQAFGFTTGITLSSPDGRIIHATMHFRGAVAIMFSPEGIWSGTMQAPRHSGAENPITLYMRCPDVDELAARARAAGAAILSEPADMFWGERIARIADPDGYVWCFANRVGSFDPGRMPLVADVSPMTSLERGAEDSPASDLDFEF